jgi:hypothetical protein
MVGGACARPGAPEFRDTCLARSETSPRVVLRAPLAIFERAVDGPMPEWHSANCSLIDTDDVGLVECRVAVGPRGSCARRPGYLMLVHDNVQVKLCAVATYVLCLLSAMTPSIAQALVLTPSPLRHPRNISRG